MGQREHSGSATVESFARDARYSSEFASLAVEGRMTNYEFLTRHQPLVTRHRGAATPLHASQMRWLFVGEAQFE